jgi:hypothetical protein
MLTGTGGSLEGVKWIDKGLGGTCDDLGVLSLLAVEHCCTLVWRGMRADVGGS